MVEFLSSMFQALGSMLSVREMTRGAPTGSLVTGVDFSTSGSMTPFP